jgi:hypothetical protein
MDRFSGLGVPQRVWAKRESGRAAALFLAEEAPPQTAVFFEVNARGAVAVRPA